MNANPATVIPELTLPSPRDLEPWLRKLLASPDSVVIIAIEKPLGADGPRVAFGWLSPAERVALRKALFAVNARRAKKGSPATTEMP